MTYWSAAVLVALAMIRGGAPAPRTPVLVELFTSEGCSSCPPADALLATLLRDQPVLSAEIVALEWHVDYWNRLGWKDPFSSPAFSERQQRYAIRFGSEPYTPQMVVDGRHAFVGSDSRKADDAVTDAAARPHLPLRVSARSSGNIIRLTIDLPSSNATTEPIEAFAAVTEDGLSSVVRRGENSGRTLPHVAVVRKVQTVGVLEREAFVAEGQWRLEPDWTPANLRIVVWLQGKKSFHVYAAASHRM